MTEKSDHTILVLAAAAIAVVCYMGWNSPTDTESKLNNCLAELKGFKDGVLYGR